MRIRLSFRIKITLLTVLISGTVLLFFALSLWGLLLKTKFDYIDDNLRSLGESHVPPHHQSIRWDRFYERIESLVPHGVSDTVLTLVKGPEGQAYFQSPKWPETLSVDLFPNPTPNSIDNSNHREPPPHQNTDFRERRGGPGPPDNRPGNRPRPNNERPSRDRMPPLHTPFADVTPSFMNFSEGEMHWRIVIYPGDGYTLVVGLSLNNTYADLDDLKKALFIAFPIALLLIGGGGWLIANRAIQPVHRLTEAAEGIHAKKLGQRIPHANESKEFERLIAVFNQMLGRLDTSFQQATRFSADASHELKTPLTILQGELESALQQCAVGSPEQKRFNALLEEVQRLKNITRKLLLISQADTGNLPIRAESLNLSELIEEALEDYAILSPEAVFQTILIPQLKVEGDRDFITQIVNNLISNAIKYRVDNSVIHCQLYSENDYAVFKIENHTAPISEKERTHFFERFYRTDKSRNRAVDGFGLGLSLAQELAQAHRGSLELEHSAEDRVILALKVPLVS